MSYRQDLSGFGEPREGCWDGFQRINSETRSGGIIGIFRHGAAEIQRNVVVRNLDPNAAYQIKEAPTGNKLFTLTGKDLAEMGFPVKLNKLYDGALFEVCKVN